MDKPATDSISKIIYPWNPDRGDGTYQNPIVCADYSDPDVVRDGDDFYMTASSFTCTPGLPILHSRDLVNWTLINHALKNNPDPRGVFDEPQHGCGVWAPAIRKHAGKFWIFFPMPDEGIYVVTADDPAGQWSQPHLLQEGKGLIDPCPLWDDDGQAYLVHAYAGSRAGIKNKLRVRPMAPDGSRLLGEGQIVFEDAQRHPTLEGPKFHKRDGWYYISAPAGGVSTGWQLILRSRSVYGPYEPKVVLERGSTPVNGPHQGAIVDTPDGEAWFVHFQDADMYGRIIHLQPVQWKDGWPLMGVDHDDNGVGEPVPQHRKPNVAGKVPVAVPQTSDEFDGDRLGLQWQWYANHRDDWHSLTARKGHLRLRAVATPDDFSRTPNLLLQKFPAAAFGAQTQIELSGDAVEAGLIVMGKSHAAVTVRRNGSQMRVMQIINNRTIAQRSIESGPVRCRVDVAAGGICEFSVGQGAEPMQAIGERFQAEKGGWIGAKVGVFCRAVEGSAGDAAAEFDYFRFSPPSDAPRIERTE